MDNNFSTQVKEIISYSREEALRLGNDFIGAERRAIRKAATGLPQPVVTE